MYHRSLLALERRQYQSRRLKSIIPVSAEVKRDIMANYSIDGARISVLYNGVDLECFHPAKRSEFGAALRARWQIPAAAPLVLFVGSGFRRKGLDYLIAIWQRAELGQVYLLVVGGDARRASYQARGAARAPGTIVVAGRQDEIENYYAPTAQRSGKVFALLRRAGDPSPGQAASKVAEDYAWTRHFERLDALLRRGSGRAQVCVS